MPISINKIRRDNNRFIKKYERFGTSLFLSTLRKQSEDFNPDLMTNAYIEFYQFVFVESAKRQYRYIRDQEAQTKDFQLDSIFLSTWREWIKQYVINNLANVITNVNAVTLRYIQEVTGQGIEDGLNPTEIAKQLYKIVGNKARALAIAKTEGTTANNMGTVRSAEDWEMMTGTTLYKVWIHSGNPREPRESHIFAQNKPIPKGELFNIEGVGMMYPGDKQGGASQIINCLCTHSYMSERLARRKWPNAFE